MLQCITRYLRFVLPLVVLLLIATYLVLSPALHSHAAGFIHHVVSDPHNLLPDILWPGR